MGFNNSYLKKDEFINIILNSSNNGYNRKLDSFEKGVRRSLLEMEDVEFKSFMREISYNRKRIRRSKKYWETKKQKTIAENYGGWSELYLIKGGRDLGVEESVLEVKEDAKRGEIKRAFAKFNKGKLKNRLVLSKFVDMVAA